MESVYVDDTELEQVTGQAAVVQEEGVEFLGRRVKGISGSTIKIIALVSMLIDHTAAVLLGPLMQRMFEQNGYTQKVAQSLLYNAYRYMRNIGRIGFPIFCFLLVEGFIYTRSKSKYVIRLGLFAIISEVSFDLAFNSSVLEFGYQNVFVTLFLGMCVIIIVDKILHMESFMKVVKVILTAAVITLGMYLAHIARCDYAQYGVFTIVMMYFFRKYKVAEMYAGCLSLTIPMLDEAWSFIAMIPIALYNGKRGLKLKYIFYIFYPAHLLILAGLAQLLKVV